MPRSCPECGGTGLDPDPFFGDILGMRCGYCMGTGDDPNDTTSSYPYIPSIPSPRIRKSDKPAKKDDDE